MGALSRPGTVNVFGVPLSPLTLDQTLDLVHETIIGRGRLQIGVVNAAKLVNMHRNLQLQDDVLSSDIILADGRSVLWASRLLGRILPERVTGIDLMFGMLERGHRARYGIYLLGATEDSLRLTARKISQNYTGVRVVGKRNGFFSHVEEKRIVQDIERACPDILLIAMSSPQKERFLGRWGKCLCVPVCHGVGGAFDVMAGKVNRAPSAWQYMGLEWLYRLKQEPRRLFKRYFITNTWFFIMVISELIKRKKNGIPQATKSQTTKSPVRFSI